MNIRNAGKTIREARLKAGLTQEQLSHGICSTLSLSRIERGVAGISPITFQLLMTRSGAPSEVYPFFANRTDFNCFYALKRTSLFLGACKLQEAYDELEKIEHWNFAMNRFYYQEWLYLHARLQQKSGSKHHEKILALLQEALSFTCPDLNLSDFHHTFLSVLEIEILMATAQELLQLDQPELCHSICLQLSEYLSDLTITYLEKDRLLAEWAIVYGYYLLYQKSYTELLPIVDYHRHKMLDNSEDSPLLQLTFLTSLGYYYTGDSEKAYYYFKCAYFSALSIDNYFAATCRSYIMRNSLFELEDYIIKQHDIAQQLFPIKRSIDTSAFSDGTYDILSSDTFSVGKLIKHLRIEQNLSQMILCQGLCSKSTLSKIENDSLQPNIFLTEALFQRLGITDRIFTFFGNSHDAKLHELRFKLIHDNRSSDAEQLANIKYFKQFILSDDLLSEQYYQYYIAMLEKDIEISIRKLFDALYLTLPDFNIIYIHNYRLSWNELTILNGIAYQYRFTDTPFIGTQILQKLFEYYDACNIDILLKVNTCTISLSIISRSLYVQKRFSELCALLTEENKHLLQFRLAIYDTFLFYYSQSLAECSQYDTATEYAVYCCELETLFNFPLNADALRKYFFEDFSIHVP